MPNEDVIRLLVDTPLDGPPNMARDEALLERVGAGESPPTLRLYQWDPPTISLGYFQRYADYESLPPPAGRLPVVRRQTGGGAILHDLELTYSLSLPNDHPLIARGANRLYERAHDAIIACLSCVDLEANRCGASDDSGAARGPFFCFERRHCYDLLIGADKVAGSAQRRTRNAVLQHGSIILANRFPQQASAFIDDLSAPRTSGTKPQTPACANGRNYVALDGHKLSSTEDDALPIPEGFEHRLQAVRESIPDHFARVLGVTVNPLEWQLSELARAKTLVEKYAGDAWTRRS